MSEEGVDMELYERIYLSSISIEKPRLEKKEHGQFFTPVHIAEYMSKLSNVRNEHISILDPGAGTGILSITLCHDLLKHKQLKKVSLDLYENDLSLYETLTDNLEQLATLFQVNGKEIEYKINKSNFITENQNIWNSDFDGLYDIVISNPPYKKISINSDESLAMKNIVKGQPNIYFLFIAMSLKLLKETGEMIFITPRSFTSGNYFNTFRKYLFENADITDIHLFQKRHNTFMSEKVLQETIIFRMEKAKRIGRVIKITTSDDSSMELLSDFTSKQKDLLKSFGNHLFFFTPKTVEEDEVIEKINRLNNNLVSLGYKIKTGPVVDFRMKDLLSSNKDETVPLIWAQNFQDNKIIIDNNAKIAQYIEKLDNNYLTKNQNTLLIKRFSSIEESKRLQCAIYEPINGYDIFGIENHLNYLSKLDESTLSGNEIYGLFNSTIYDQYYRILNGSTQVNATEINHMPLPSIEIILAIGNELINSNDLSVENCNEIVLRNIWGE